VQGEPWPITSRGPVLPPTYNGIILWLNLAFNGGAVLFEDVAISAGNGSQRGKMLRQERT